MNCSAPLPFNVRRRRWTFEARLLSSTKVSGQTVLISSSLVTNSPACSTSGTRVWTTLGASGINWPERYSRARSPSNWNSANRHKRLSSLDMSTTPEFPKTEIIKNRGLRPLNYRKVESAWPGTHHLLGGTANDSIHLTAFAMDWGRGGDRPGGWHQCVGRGSRHAVRDDSRGDQSRRLYGRLSDDHHLYRHDRLHDAAPERFLVQLHVEAERRRDDKARRRPAGGGQDRKSTR